MHADTSIDETWSAGVSSGGGHHCRRHRRGLRWSHGVGVADSVVVVLVDAWSGSFSQQFVENTGIPRRRHLE